MRCRFRRSAVGVVESISTAPAGTVVGSSWEVRTARRVRALVCYYEPMSHRLQVLIPEPLDAEIRKAAQRRRVSKGAWVRGAIERALSDERSGDDPLARLSSLGAPTADPEQMLEEIEAGRRR